MQRSAQKGNYIGAAFHGVRQLATLPVALADDVLGGAYRGASNLVSGPVEDAGRALMGMEDRAAAATPAPTSPRTQAAPPQPAAPIFAAPSTATRSLRQSGAGEEGVVTRKGNSFSGTNVSGYAGSGKNPIQSIPGMPQADIDRALTNPDGSRWSALDNSRMAANLRDGADPYAGTSRAPAPDPVRDLALSPKGTPGRKAALAIYTNQQNNSTTLRGQDITAQGNRMTAATANARMTLDQQNKLRDDARLDRTADSTISSADQTRSHNARNNLAAELKVFGDDKKVDEAGSAAALSMVQKIMPGADQLTGEALSKNLPEMKALAKIFGRASQNPQMGIDKVNPLESRAPEMDELPDWKGGKLVKEGLMGAVTPGSSVGNWYIEDKNGTKTPLGKDLSAREIEIIRHHVKTGRWLDAPKKTESN